MLVLHFFMVVSLRLLKIHCINGHLTIWKSNILTIWLQHNLIHDAGLCGRIYTDRRISPTLKCAESQRICWWQAKGHGFDVTGSVSSSTIQFSNGSQVSEIVPFDIIDTHRTEPFYSCMAVEGCRGTRKYLFPLWMHVQSSRKLRGSGWLGETLLPVRTARHHSHATKFVLVNAHSSECIQNRKIMTCTLKSDKN